MQDSKTSLPRHCFLSFYLVFSLECLEKIFLFSFFRGDSTRFPPKEEAVGFVLLTIITVFGQICSSVQFNTRRPWEGESNCVIDGFSLIYMIF